MAHFFSPLLCLLAITVLVASLAETSASAEVAGIQHAHATPRVTICHPLAAPGVGGEDVVVYRAPADDGRLIREHRDHGDVILEGADQECPGHVVQTRTLDS